MNERMQLACPGAALPVDVFNGVSQVLAGYGGSLAPDGTIMNRSGKRLSVTLHSDNQRLYFVGNGHTLADGAISGGFVEEFVENFWLWRKPTSALLKVVTAFHGTTATFERFNRTPGGIHIGTYDQAVHAATVKLSRIPLAQFAQLTEDVHGWRGNVLKVQFTARAIKRVEDVKTAERWEEEIARAHQAGFDTLVYLNEFEGRGPANSYVVFDPASINVVASHQDADEPVIVEEMATDLGARIPPHFIKEA